jgi:hypothetical protein
MVVIMVVIAMVAVVAMIPMPMVVPISTAARKNAPGGGKQHDSANKQQNDSHDQDSSTS